MCWGFEVTPVKLQKIYWSHTLDEIQMVVKLKLGWYQAQALQEYQLMAILLSEAFGDSKDTEEPQPFSSLGEAQMALNRVFAR